MTLEDILASLFPHGHDVTNDRGVLFGTGKPESSTHMLVIGVAGRTPVGVDDAIRLSNFVLTSLAKDTGPILVMVDSDSQRMSKRDELLGLSEFVAHLAKTLIHADLHGRPTIGLLYGHSAAGAFLGTALATRVLVALPEADPAVMDLPSMARVTKLPLSVLQEKAQGTPVFAPGLHNLMQAGAIHHVWNETSLLNEQLLTLLAELPDSKDRRDTLGKQRGGRMKAADIAEQVCESILRSL